MLPIEVYQAHQTREIDRIVIEQHGIPGIFLMRRAGEAAFNHIMTRHSGIAHLVVVCGSGNNGGDGYVLALCARKIGIDVTVLATSSASTADASTVCRDYLDSGGKLTDSDSSVFTTAELVVDALFGTGLSRAPEGSAAELIIAMNNAGCPVVSLDMPSGLDSDTGLAYSPCVMASSTVTFIGLKLGLLTGQGRSHAGEIIFEDLNVPTEARCAVQPVARIIQQPRLEKRGREFHKGNAGRILITGGDTGMLGAVLLAGEAALRCGSGLVTVSSTEEHLDLPALRCPELMSIKAVQDGRDGSPDNIDTIVLGPGLGQSNWGEQVFDSLENCTLPMVVDADGLNWLARKPRHRSDWILTPHPGEAARLLQITPVEIQADRLSAVREIVTRYGGACILKGAGTLVSCSDETVFLCDRGNPGMATAGMGDVLSGIAGSLLSQGLSIDDAAKTAAWLHATVADAVAGKIGERSLLARDVIDNLATVMCELVPT